MGPEKLEQVPMLTSLAVTKPEAQPAGSGKPVHLLGSWACGLIGVVRSVPSASQSRTAGPPGDQLKIGNTWLSSALPPSMSLVASHTHRVPMPVY